MVGYYHRGPFFFCDWVAEGIVSSDSHKGGGNRFTLTPLFSSPPSPLVPCSADTGQGFTTGGGFSNKNPRPVYQNNAVEQYLASGVELPPSSWYNKTGRGYNDLTGLGNMMVIVWNGGVDFSGMYVSLK
tara:strand:- start:108 stop:494 length:387 start_codon:yes stop_codon:yes gene_type:complete